MNTSAEISGVMMSGDRIAIIGHTDPDGDTVGSCFAMVLALKAAGKTPAVFLERLGTNFSYIPGQEMLCLLAGGEPLKPPPGGLAFDTAVCLDCATPKRMGAAESLFRGTPVTVCIDHHLGNAGFADYNLVCPKLSSTCEVTYDVITNFSALTKDIATCLYTGIVLDTGGFKHTCTSPRTHEIAARLIECGAPFNYIHRVLFDRKTVAEARILQLAIGHVEFALDGKLAFTYVTAEDMERASAVKEDLEHIVNFILNIGDVETSVFAYPKAAAQSKVRMRSRSINVAAVCAVNGGGGHMRAAGCELNCEPRDVLANVFYLIEHAEECPDGFDEYA